MKKKQKSPQLIWQHNKLAQGLCRGCGKRPLHTSHLCVECYGKQQEYNTRYMDEHREEQRERCRRWRLKNPNYYKKRLKKTHLYA